MAALGRELQAWICRQRSAGSGQGAAVCRQVAVAVGLGGLGRMHGDVGMSRWQGAVGRAGRGLLAWCCSQSAGGSVVGMQAGGSRLGAGDCKQGVVGRGLWAWSCRKGAAGSGPEVADSVPRVAGKFSGQGLQAVFRGLQEGSVGRGLQIVGRELQGQSRGLQACSSGHRALGRLQGAAGRVCGQGTGCCRQGFTGRGLQA